MRRTTIPDRFRSLARTTAEAVGHPLAFALAAATVSLWALSGPFLGFSATWQLAINTTTTIATFLMVFLLQGSQNHDARVMHLKIDELLRAVADARTGMARLGDETEAGLREVEEELRG